MSASSGPANAAVTLLSKGSEGGERFVLATDKAAHRAPRPEDRLA